MAKGKTVCAFCGVTIPSSRVKEHIQREHANLAKPLSLIPRILKIIILFSISFCLFYYSFSAWNPIVSVVLAFLGGCILADFVINVKKLKTSLAQKIIVQKFGEKKRESD